MQRAYRLLLSKVTAIGGLLIASPALAHIDLLDPPARAHGTAASGDTAVDVNANQKSGPCGQVAPGRTTDRVTTYAPGETITIRVREETPHNSYLRVAIDLDGNDFPERPTPVATQTQEQAQAAEDALANDGLLEVVVEANNTPNFVHEIEVTLPDVTCDNCTLQVIQAMFGAGYYYQCADIVIAEGGGSAVDAGAAPGSGGAGTAGAGNAASGASGAAAAGSAGAAAGSAGAGGASSGGQPGSAAAGAAGSTSTGAAGAGSTDPNSPPSEDDDGGCTLSASSTSGSPNASLFGLLALALGLVRRRR